VETTLTSLLRADAVPLEQLHDRYGSLLELVRKLIGVVPNCDPYLEIWPPAFRSYNVMVPNFLNLPLSIWGLGAPKDILGLAMYVSSRTAECAYCSAHTCSFALRRGAAPEKVARAMELDDDARTVEERAAIAIARSLSRVPADPSAAEREELARHFSPATVEWIVLGIAMMGFLNKFMDAIGVELEESTVGEVDGLIGASGWAPGKHLASAAPPAEGRPPRADTLGTKLGVVPYLPSALKLDRRWTAGVPKRWPAVGKFLAERTGHDFPVLSRLRHGRAIRAIAVMLRDNLDAATTVLGLGTKCAAGAIYASTVGDAALADEVRKLAAHNPSPEENARTRAALRLAEAASSSPARIGPEVIEECRQSGLPPAAVVELIVWLSVLQMLHRLSTFYDRG
jgi:alkylhydroperoxidase family enzyme